MRERFKYHIKEDGVNMKEVTREEFNNVVGEYVIYVDDYNTFKLPYSDFFPAKKLEKETLELLKGKFTKVGAADRTEKIDEAKSSPDFWSRATGNKTDDVIMVHYNPFNNEQYCPKKERVKDLERTFSPNFYFGGEKHQVVDWFNLLGKESKSEGEEELRKLENNPNYRKIREEQKEFIKNSILNSQPKSSRIVQNEEVYTEEKLEGIKETLGKTDYSEINLEILDLMAERFSANKHKYTKGNMKKPIDIKGLEWALFRHTKKMIQPDINDVETYRQHLAAILCNASMILDQLNLQQKADNNLHNKK